LKAGLAGAGLAAGAMLVMSFTEALDQGKITARLGAQLGATPAEAEKYGKLAGRLYSNAVTEDFQTAADTISAVMRAGIAPPDATEAQLESIATKVADVASTFELDLGQTANAVGQMLKTGLAKDGTEALDAITAGMQKMGPRADDLMDTFNEYSVQFQRLGLDATTATGLISQGMKRSEERRVGREWRRERSSEDGIRAFHVTGVQTCALPIFGQMLKTGLAKDGTEALDAITAGMQKMGPRADDLMDTFNEYSVQFQRLGLDATTATGLISQGMKAGARDTDVVADALKEFTLEGVQGSEKIATGFEMIGLNADDMIRKISEGGP